MEKSLLRRSRKIGLSVLLAVLIGAILAGPIMSDVEQPAYEIISSTGDIEIRQYPSHIVAEVEMSGARKQAISEGFRLLADYIFGNNKAQQSLAMTAPVEQQQSERLAMTAPVEQQSVAVDRWQVRFIMPSEYDMNSLPQPADEAVQLREISAKYYAVIRFAGANDDENIAEHEQQLRNYLDEMQITPLSAAKYAFYNPPWTLPFLRRNEVMLEINNIRD